MAPGDRKRSLDATVAVEFERDRWLSDEPGSEPPACVAGRYELLGLLGSGGMGNVYRVRDLELDEVVALKFLRRELLAAPGMLERFRQEAKLARRVTHPNVARTFDIGEHRGERFLTMEWIDGESLAVMLRREGTLAVPRVLGIGLALCAALSAAHAAEVVHRDLKPDNVLIERRGRVVITDFGIARAVSSQTGGAMVGTAAYMAPEQIRGELVDGRADVYALGAVLFELLVGEPAWVGDGLISMAMRKLSEPPPDPFIFDPTIPEALANVVVRCMATAAADRYQAADEVAAALRECEASLVDAERGASQPGPRAEPQPLAVAPPRVGIGDRRVAVLPFRNAGPSEDEYLADELTDDLIDSLSVARGVEVRPRRMITPELAAQTDLEQLGRALDVQVIVEGGVRRRAGTVRVTARAISVAEGLQLWAKRFERPANELLTINDEVAVAVVEALAGERDAPARRAPTDPEAVDLLVRARQALRHAWMGHASLERAVALFEAGLQLAPEEPGLLSGYAMALARALNYSQASTHTSREYQRQARDAAARAIAIAPHLGESWLALATIHYTTSDWVAAVAALRAALERVPSLQKAHEMLASIEFEVGELDSAIARARGVLALDPTADAVRVDLARALALLGREQHSQAVALAGPELGASYFVLAVRLDLWHGRTRCGPLPARLAEYEDLREHVGAYRAALELGRVDAKTVDEWTRRAEAVRPGSRFRPLMSQFLAELLGHVGDLPGTLAALERADAAELFDLVWLDRCPSLARVRELPEFAALRERVASRVAPIRAALGKPGAQELQ